MNSLQLVSKIKAKADDLNKNISEVLNSNHAFSDIDKDLLKKQCLDLYEMLMKLKSDAAILEERNNSMPSVPNYNTPATNTIIDEPKTLEIIKVEDILNQDAPVLVNNFQEVIEYASQNDVPLDDLFQQVEIQEEEFIPESVNFQIITNQVNEATDSLKQHIEHLPGGDVNIGKAVENKRIQYTVMPAMDEPKPVELNASFKEKEPSFNDKIAQNNPPVVIPLADKTIDAPIDTIKSAINLNKKIAIVNELFKENVVEYAKAIEKLNGANGLNDALQIFSALNVQFQWDQNHELVRELESLVKRRFA